MTSALILPAAEYAVAEQVWAWLVENGHGECGPYSQDLADSSGTVTCSCGAVIGPVPAGGVGVPDLTPVDGGFRVKETATHYVDIIRMIYNWRLATVPKSCLMSYDRGWCYSGTGPQSFTRAVLAAMAWDGSDESEPEGWNKNIQTGEWREPEAGQAVAR